MQTRNIRSLLISLIVLACVPFGVKAQSEVNTKIDTNVFRPDGRNRVRGSADIASDALGDTSLSIGSTLFQNPETQVFELEVRQELSERVSLSAGAASVRGRVVPAVGLDWAVIDEQNSRLSLSYHYGLMTDDPRSADALLQAHAVSTSFSSGDVGGWAKATFPSDDNQLYEGGFSVNLDDWISLGNYTRIAADDSDFYWAPNSFTVFDAKLRANISDRCSVGADLGFKVDGGEVAPSFPAGLRCSLGSEESPVEFTAGYGYGAVLSLEAQFRF